MESVMILSQFSCNEHLDGVVLLSLTELLAIQLLKLSLQDTLNEAETFFRTNKDGESFDFGNALARSMRNKVYRIKQAADGFSGYSDKGKRRMITHVIKQLNKLYAELFEFYELKYEFIIRDGTSRDEN
jgi:hypothetical protein